MGASSSCSSKSSGESPGGCDSLATDTTSTSRIMYQLSTNNQNQNIRVSPNPVSGDGFYIDISDAELLSIQIYDMNGRLVKFNQVLEKNFNDIKARIKLEKVMHGVHVIMINTKEDSFVERVYFQH